MSIVRSQNCFGIFPSDIIVRSAVLESFAELRSQPWLLDFAFQALLNDPITAQAYGALELEKAKDWFLENEIKVTLGYKINNISIPHIAIWLGNQDEADATTGDINDVSNENIPWVISTAPLFTFTAAAYDLDTGTVTLPAGLTTDSIYAGMQLLDRSRGQSFAIVDVIDGQNFTIAPGTQINLSGVQVTNQNNLWNVKVKSIAHTETFTMDVVVQGDSIKCIVLHALLRWSLNRNKMRLLDGRGFTRSSTSSAGVQIAQDGQNAAQIMFKRTLTLRGVTKEYWPADVSPPVQGIAAAFDIAAGAEDSLDSLEAAQGWGTIDET